PFVLFQTLQTRPGLRFLDFNRSFELLTGCRRESLLGKNIDETTLYSDPAWLELFSQVSSNDKNVKKTYDFYQTSSERKFSVTAGENIDGKIAVIFKEYIASDISEKKEVEKELIESEERFMSIFLD